ncbi:MAG: hypothetical protein ACW99Q_08085 [Candidatus Kariarchaeaceae archaeon]|jgi:hypothetical protein
METDIQTIMEISFNLVYLAFIWIIVLLMTIKMEKITTENKSISQRFRLAFFLLALGDTGHVGFRVLAYLNGGLETNSTLVGLGALSTSLTITFFYLIFLDIWCIQFSKEKDFLYYLVMGVGIIRLFLMVFPQNEWGNVVAPYDWAIIRNIPLTIIGIVVAYLILRDGYKNQDNRYKYLGYCIGISFAFYIPVILLVQTIPMIGMLMIPKTMAYMVMAFLAFKYYFQT